MADKTACFDELIGVESAVVAFFSNAFGRPDEPDDRLPHTPDTDNAAETQGECAAGPSARTVMFAELYVSCPGAQVRPSVPQLADAGQCTYYYGYPAGEPVHVPRTHVREEAAMADKVVHFEIMGGSGDTLAAFYSKLFGWKVDSDNQWNYPEVTDAETGEQIGGAIGPDEESYAVFYIDVRDLDATLRMVEAQGGTITLPRTDVPGACSFARFRDPAGNVVGVMEFPQGAAP